MTTVMNQVKCSLCDTKNDELQRMDHIVSTNHLQLCKSDKDKVAITFFKMILNENSKKNGI